MFILIATIVIICASPQYWNKVLAIDIGIIGCFAGLAFGMQYANYHPGIALGIICIGVLLGGLGAWLLWQHDPVTNAMDNDDALQHIIEFSQQHDKVFAEENLNLTIHIECMNYHDMIRKSECNLERVYLIPRIQELTSLEQRVQNAYQSYKQYSAQIKEMYSRLSKPYLEQKQKEAQAWVHQVPPEKIVHLVFSYTTPGGTYKTTTYSISYQRVLELLNQNKRQQKEITQRKQRAEKEQDAFRALCIEHGINPDRAMKVETFLKPTQSTVDKTGVYVLHNITKQICYVGQATSMNRRLHQHFSGEGCEDAYSDWLDGDTFIIEQHPLREDDFDTLNAQEMHYIALHNSYYNGYNKTRGNHDYA
jgi:hypothetical protein